MGTKRWQGMLVAEDGSLLKVIGEQRASRTHGVRAIEREVSQKVRNLSARKRQRAEDREMAQEVREGFGVALR